MANVRTLQRSFAGGEVSPEMYGRLDDIKYQTGVALCSNFIVKAQGPLENRAGFQYVCAVKDSSKKTRLIPFTYSTTQTMVLEMGEGYFRFHTLGATLLYSAPAAWNTGTGYVVGDMHSNGGTNYYCTTAHTSGTFATDLAAGKWYALPASLVYEIPSPYAEADLFDIHYVQSADVLTLVHPGYAPRELRRYGATNWQLSTIAFAAAIAAPTGVSATQTGSGADYTYSYVVTAFAADEISESVASTAATVACNLYTTGNFNTISWSAVSGATRYNVYKMQGGIHGYIGQTTGLSIVDDNIAPDLSVTPPTYETVFNTAGEYPGAVSYFEQRRAFAGTTNDPQQLWMTKSGTESNMSYSLPIRDDDRISFRVAAREANTIRHIVPLSQLLLLTSAAEWRVTSINSDAITPSSVSVRPQSYVGASNVQPAIVNSNLIYGAARGGHVRELSYTWQANGFVTGDLSLRATHLFDSYEILDMAYSKAPQPLLWFVSDSGNIIGLTYIPEQQIGAWHQHSTENGVFESCTVVAEGPEDVLYVVIKRYIDGNYVRYIEFLHTRAFTALEDAFFVDSGLSYDGTNTTATTITVSGGTDWTPGEELTLTASAPAFAFPATTDVGDAIVLTDSDGLLYYLTISSTTSTTVAKAYVDRTLVAELRNAAITAWAFARGAISGLDHLEGETVNVLIDGAVHPQCTVASGAISLETVAVKAHVGIPIQADIETLPLAVQVDQAIGQGRYKNINKGWLRVYSSSGIWIGPDTDHLVEAKQRTTEPYGSPPALKTGEVPVMLTPSWADSGGVCIRQTDPLPLTIVALTLEVALGG